MTISYGSPALRVWAVDLRFDLVRYSDTEAPNSFNFGFGHSVKKNFSYRMAFGLEALTRLIMLGSAPLSNATPATLGVLT